MYGVVPSKRKKGYGTIICKLLLKEAKKLGLTKVTITCNHDNICSIKIIKKNNGILIDRKKDIENNLINRYNINL